MLHALPTDTVLLASDFDPLDHVVVGSEMPPLMNWLLWGVFLACVAMVVFFAGKLTWEKWSRRSSGSDAMTFLLGSLFAAVMTGSAGATLLFLQT
jgi:hypothetical protein